MLPGGHCVIEHHRTERAGNRNLGGPGRDGLIPTIHVDLRADFFFHPHARATGTAAERLIAVALHLDTVNAGCIDEITRWHVDLVVTPEIARVVVGDLFFDLRDWRQPPGLY